MTLAAQYTPTIAVTPRILTSLIDLDDLGSVSQIPQKPMKLKAATNAQHTRHIDVGTHFAVLVERMANLITELADCRIQLVINSMDQFGTGRVTFDLFRLLVRYSA